MSGPQSAIVLTVRPWAHHNDLILLRVQTSRKCVASPSRAQHDHALSIVSCIIEPLDRNASTLKPLGPLSRALKCSDQSATLLHKVERHGSKRNERKEDKYDIQEKVQYLCLLVDYDLLLYHRQQADLMKVRRAMSGDKKAKAGRIGGSGGKNDYGWR